MSEEILMQMNKNMQMMNEQMQIMTKKMELLEEQNKVMYELLMESRRSKSSEIESMVNELTAQDNFEKEMAELKPFGLDEEVSKGENLPGNVLG